MTLDSSLNPERIREWIAALDKRDVELQQQIEPLAREQASNRERRRLLGELLSSYGSVEMPAEPRSVSEGAESVGGRIRRQVREVLAESGNAMHINDIHAAFLRLGYEIPGQGRPANITAHLGGDEEIVSPQRGYYGLRSVVGDVKRKPTASRKRRRRAR